MEVPLKAGGIHIANIKVVHAKIHRVAAASVRVGPEPRPDRSQLFDLASQRFEVPETHAERQGSVGRCRKAGTRPGWKSRCSDIACVATKPVGPRRTLRTFIRSCNPIVT